ncbi:MAG TPA: methionine--tRNA ligase [Gemmatimonadales bacterium]|nr:methionine--tRNA ligase [Gemmatimonadales bacterium]
MAKFYLTTAIDYSNGDPHLGHALEKIGADCIARYRRLRGDQVRFVMGMDEHGQKVAMAAEQAALAPQAWVDRISERFEATWRALHCSHDDWIRTTEPRHHAAVTEFLHRIQQHHPEDLFVGDYEGLYCVGCEEFKQESQLANGRCLEHPELIPIRMKERNHFFRLSRYGPRVLELISSGSLRVEPAIRRHEVSKVLEGGLEDVSISRSRFPWGIPFPDDPEHTVYVWFDALINYLTAAGFPAAGWERLWPADVHVIGKGITRLHCCLWPAMLLAAELPLPRMVWAHGYVQWEGAKVSKSAGGAVSVDEAIERHGPDALRYFLLREVGFTGDGNFTWERFDERYTADLADGLGNLVSRTLAMLAKYRDGIVPVHQEKTTLDAAGVEAVEAYTRAMDHFELREGADIVGKLVAAANHYIVKAAPWTLAKEGRDAELDEALASLARCLFRLAVLGSPFLPEKAQALWHSLGRAGSPGAGDWSALDHPPVAGDRVVRSSVLFPKPEQVS